MEEVPASLGHQRMATLYFQAIADLEDAREREKKLMREIQGLKTKVYDQQRALQIKDEEIKLEQSSALISVASTDFGSRVTIGDLSDNFDFRDVDFERDFEEEATQLSSTLKADADHLRAQVDALQARCSHLVVQNSDYRLVLDELSTAHRALLCATGRRVEQTQLNWKNGTSPGRLSSPIRRESGPETAVTVAPGVTAKAALSSLVSPRPPTGNVSSELGSVTAISALKNPTQRSQELHRFKPSIALKNTKPGRKITQYIKELSEGNQ